MNTLTLSTDSWTQLANQVTQNGTFIHLLRADNDMICATAYVNVEQCAKAVSVRIELGDSVNTLTLSDRNNTAERVALFLEELANGATPSSKPKAFESPMYADKTERKGARP